MVPRSRPFWVGAGAMLALAVALGVLAVFVWPPLANSALILIGSAATFGGTAYGFRRVRRGIPVKPTETPPVEAAELAVRLDHIAAALRRRASRD